MRISFFCPKLFWVLWNTLFQGWFGISMSVDAYFVYCFHYLPPWVFPHCLLHLFLFVFTANGCPSERVNPSAAQPLHQKGVRNHVSKFRLIVPLLFLTFSVCPLVTQSYMWDHRRFLLLFSSVSWCNLGLWTKLSLFLQRNWEDFWGGDAHDLVWGGK